MSKAGRKLRNGVRTPSGQHSRAATVATHVMAPSEVIRMREAAKAKAIDPLWGTELGRMHLQAEINAVQLEAGRRWASLAAAKASALGLKTLKAMNLTGHTPGHEPDPSSDAGLKIAEREAKAVAAYASAESRLELAGSRILLAVEVLCEDDKPLEWSAKRDAVVGLDLLCEMWGLTRNRT